MTPVNTKLVTGWKVTFYETASPYRTLEESIDQDSTEGLAVPNAKFLEADISAEGKRFLEVKKGLNIARADPAKYAFTVKIENTVPKNAKLEILVAPGISLNQKVLTDSIATGLVLEECKIDDVNCMQD